MFNRTEKWLFAAAAIYASVVLSSCTIIDSNRKPPADWPKLEVTEKKVGFWEMQALCQSNGASSEVTAGVLATFLLKQYAACTVIYFDTKLATIYYASDDEYGRLAVVHERRHTKGYDHIGGTTLRDAWAAWRDK